MHLKTVFFGSSETICVGQTIPNVGMSIFSIGNKTIRKSSNLLTTWGVFQSKEYDSFNRFEIAMQIKSDTGSLLKKIKFLQHRMYFQKKFRFLQLMLFVCKFPNLRRQYTRILCRWNDIKEFFKVLDQEEI